MGVRVHNFIGQGAPRGSAFNLPYGLLTARSPFLIWCESGLAPAGLTSGACSGVLSLAVYFVLGGLGFGFGS